MRKNALTRAVVRYLTSTTLHGFKYLRVPNYADRTVWVAWCVASAGCAGALCLVLWARFTEVPTVLSLQSVRAAAAVLPTLALCAPAPLVAERVVAALNVPDEHSLTTVGLTRFLRGLPAPSQQMSQLETALQQQQQTLNQLLLSVTPPCDKVSVRCQVDSHPIKCEKVVHRDLTIHGACCVLRPSNRPKNEEVFYTKIKSMAIVLNCSDEDIMEYDLLIHHEGKGWLKSTVISPGYTYYSPLTYKFVLSDSERVIESTCVSNEGYSQSACQTECVESTCGCRDPMQSDKDNDDGLKRPFCSLEELACLRSQTLDRKSCNCYPSCKQIRTNMSLKQNPMYGLKYNVVDPLYKGLNPNRSSVLKVQIEQTGSYVFARMPTESWLTLLSSLGGVFNMFLGVGLFSALELIYFLFISIPLAIRRSLEIEISSAVVPRPK